MTQTASQRVLARLKEEISARGLHREDLANALTARTGETWTIFKVSKILRGEVQLQMDDADAFAAILNLPLTEVVRDRGVEFCAEMTPTEVRIWERLRQRPQLMEAVMLILDVRKLPPPDLIPRSPKRKVGRPLNSERTVD